MKSIFRSERYFTIFDFFISHRQLLIRSNKDDESGNIDIIFFGVKFIQLPTDFTSIEIEICDSDLVSHIDKIINKNDKVFLLKTEENGCFYLIASFVEVYINNLEFSETSLGLVKNSGRKDVVASSLKVS